MPGQPRNAAKAKKSYNLGKNEILFDLTVPSGALCQVKRPGPMGLIQAGILDRLDVLGSLVQTEHVDRVSGQKSEEDEKAKQKRMIQELMQDKEKLVAATDLIDKVICFVVTEPKINPLPEPGVERDPEKVYVDSVDFEDKEFIFQFVMGGTADLATFREERQKIVGDVESLKALQDSAE